ncbi:YtfJ family protein [Salinivibrio socompensis]|uniref:YtfJ family protein n=1 Tax=Salinivibrio socompensis TaxID=1510206 RepID=UPI000471BC85|nr:YtfJ family protein [Salinivibrio socompensis]
MKKIPLLTLSVALLASTSWAHTIQNGAPLPTASVTEHGELTLKDKDLVYANWQTEQLPGKVRVIQAIAGRSSAKEMNAPLMDAITAADFDDARYQTTTIINQDDAMWGTGGFVKSSAEDSKREFSWSSIVLDENGSVAKAWRLKEESALIAVLDEKGMVRFVKEGKLSEDEVNQVFSLVAELVNQ